MVLQSLLLVPCDHEQCCCRAYWTSNGAAEPKKSVHLHDSHPSCHLLPFPPIQGGPMEKIACLCLFACFCWLVFACLDLLAYVCLRVLACCFCWLVCACLLLLACVCLRVLACFFLLVFACLLLLACVSLLLLRNRIRWAGSVSELLSDVSRSPPAPTIRDISE